MCLCISVSSCAFSACSSSVCCVVCAPFLLPLLQTLELTEMSMRDSFCSPCVISSVAATQNRVFFAGNLASIICRPTTTGVQLLAQQLMQARRENVMLEQALRDEKVINTIRKRVVCPSFFLSLSLELS